jgi:Fe2+ or Zn2+ uptake regulation protein
MLSAEETACREDLRRAGLPAQRALADLLRLLRNSAETHLGLSDVVRMAARTGLAATPAGLVRQLETLADHGLLGRLPTTTAEVVFDTVPQPHCHLVYEESAQIVDIHVSPETLLAILRQALANSPDEVEVLVRFRANRRAALQSGLRKSAKRFSARNPL